MAKWSEKKQTKKKKRQNKEGGSETKMSDKDSFSMFSRKDRFPAPRWVVAHLVKRRLPSDTTRIRTRTRELGSKTSFPTHGDERFYVDTAVATTGRVRGSPKATGSSKVGRVIVSNNVTDRLTLQREVPCSRSGGFREAGTLSSLIIPRFMSQRKEGRKANLGVTRLGVKTPPRIVV